MERERLGKTRAPAGEQMVDCMYSWAHSGRKLFNIEPERIQSSRDCVDSAFGVVSTSVRCSAFGPWCGPTFTWCRVRAGADSSHNLII